MDVGCERKKELVKGSKLVNNVRFRGLKRNFTRFAIARERGI